MRKIFSILLPFLLLSVIGWTCCSCQSNSKKAGNREEQNADTKPEAVPVIMDTDISGDYDDVGAMAMLHALADKGEVRILGTIASNQSPLVAPTIEVINTYYGRPDLPIGAPKISGTSRDSRNLRWPDTLVANFPHTIKSNDDVPGAVQVYRSLLRNQPDTSVTIVTVGYLTNMKNLLQSPPDSISDMNGMELVKKKVKKWVAMAGNFETGKEANVRKDREASHYAISHWPTPVIFSGFEIGKDVITGMELISSGEETPITIPYREGISKRSVDRKGRPSWDQTAVLAAARGFAPYYSALRGKFTASEDGISTWEDDPEGPHIRLVREMEVGALTREIEALMMHKPK
ncbi:nucleoside hydrolase [Sinomicrobium weinanense]|uniref:Nucleoside hydrolase n=1 Tax=Sinomicrobium weinanense TaxID=2842200 RepID=A0A926JQT6_9FLAO|nr:nucleoside hydrolase [Sinomicrobium weinanense]MBC9795748.1 nucleoside hydrolase [Sinomicrobium weinanense]MBU3125311.1 nucleoside hydrolase [Sinomicrobium weinanense]